MKVEFKVVDNRLFYSGSWPKNDEEALAISIRKWEILSENPDIEPRHTTTCGFCMLYWCSGCRECPVYKHTGKIECEDTPYVYFDDAITFEEKREYALDELEFLKGLRV